MEQVLIKSYSKLTDGAYINFDVFIYFSFIMLLDLIKSFSISKDYKSNVIVILHWFLRYSWEKFTDKKIRFCKLYNPYILLRGVDVRPTDKLVLLFRYKYLPTQKDKKINSHQPYLLKCILQIFRRFGTSYLILQLQILLLLASPNIILPNLDSF